ncbi:MAG: YcxB family protein [Bacteroidia bacterium]|nr:YcxB family protein [Bacteroidia bacterium]
MIFLLGLSFLLILWILFYFLNILNLPRPLFYQYLTVGLILIVQPLAIFLTIRRNYFSSNHLRESLEMEVTKTDFKIKGESFYLEVIWDKIFRIVEHSECFLIYQNNLSAIIILKKDLSPEQLIEIKEILKNVSERSIRLKK